MLHVWSYFDHLQALIYILQNQGGHALKIFRNW